MQKYSKQLRYKDKTVHSKVRIQSTHKVCVLNENFVMKVCVNIINRTLIVERSFFYILILQALIKITTAFEQMSYWLTLIHYI